jgi:hypothetical protein
MNILPPNIGNLYSRAVTILGTINTCGEVDWLVYVGEFDVPESHVLHVASTRIRFDPLKGESAFPSFGRSLRRAEEKKLLLDVLSI